MARKILKTFLVIISALPFTALAAPTQSAVQVDCPGGKIPSGILKGMPCDKPVGSDSLDTALQYLEALARNIGGFLLTIAGVLFIIMFIVGGIQYITSAGNEDRAKGGKKTLTAAVIGLLITILAYAIVKVFATFIGGGVS